MQQRKKSNLHLIHETVALEFLILRNKIDLLFQLIFSKWISKWNFRYFKCLSLRLNSQVMVVL